MNEDSLPVKTEVNYNFHAICIHISLFYLSINSSIYLYVYIYNYFIYLLIHLSIYSSIYLIVRPSIHPSIYPPTHILSRPSIYLFIQRSIFQLCILYIDNIYKDMSNVLVRCIIHANNTISFLKWSYMVGCESRQDAFRLTGRD